MRTVVAVALLICTAGTAGAQNAPPNVVVEYTSINRSSAKKDANGNDLPPFTSATVFIPWQKKPFAVDGTATVLAITPYIEPLAVKVVSVKKLPMGNQCTGEKPLYEMKGAPTTRAALANGPARR